MNFKERGTLDDDTTQDQEKKLKINYELMKRWAFFLEPQGQNLLKKNTDLKSDVGVPGLLCKFNIQSCHFL